MMFGSEKRRAANRIAALEERGQMIFAIIRSSVDEYLEDSNLTPSGRKAIAAFLTYMEEDTSWVADPGFLMTFSRAITDNGKARINRAHEALVDELGRIETLANETAWMLSDLDAVKRASISTLATSIVEWFELRSGVSARGRADWVLAYALADNILQSRYAPMPNAAARFVIGDHTSEISFVLAALWSESSNRRSLRA